MKILKKILFGMGFAVVMTGAQAATINLTPSINSAPQGGQVSFNLIADFGTTPVLSGGVDFSWGSAVMTYDSFVYDAGFLPLTQAPLDIIDPQNSGLLTVNFGNSGGLILNGPTIVGTLVFNVIGAPTSSTPISLSDSVKYSGFYDAVNFNPIPVDYSGATVNVSTVPLPAPFWLLLSGIGSLGFASRRKVS